MITFRITVRRNERVTVSLLDNNSVRVYINHKRLSIYELMYSSSLETRLSDIMNLWVLPMLYVHNVEIYETDENKIEWRLKEG